MCRGTDDHDRKVSLGDPQRRCGYVFCVPSKRDTRNAIYTINNFSPELIITENVFKNCCHLINLTRWCASLHNCWYIRFTRKLGVNQLCIIVESIIQRICLYDWNSELWKSLDSSDKIFLVVGEIMLQKTENLK